MKLNEIITEASTEDQSLQAAFDWLTKQQYRYRKNTGDTGNGEAAKKFKYRIVNGSLEHDERSPEGSAEKSTLEGQLQKLGVPAKYIGHMVFFG